MPCAQFINCVQLFETLWTVACQAPLSMGFSRQEYWSGLTFPSSGDLPDPGIKPTSLLSTALADAVFTTSSPGKPLYFVAGILCIHFHLSFLKTLKHRFYYYSLFTMRKLRENDLFMDMQLPDDREFRCGLHNSSHPPDLSNQA